MGARNQVGIGLSYRPASLCSLATQFQTRFLESIPRPVAELRFPTQNTNRVVVPAEESIPRLYCEPSQTKGKKWGIEKYQRLPWLDIHRCLSCRLYMYYITLCHYNPAMMIHRCFWLVACMLAHLWRSFKGTGSRDRIKFFDQNVIFWV
jgi:hypothetical protein